MIKRIDRYIGVSVMLGVLVVWLGLTALTIMFSLLNELGTAGGTSISDLAWFVVLTAPRWTYEVFPISALLGALIALGGLAAANELVAFRTSGASRLRIAGSALGATLILTIPAMAIGEWVAPAAVEQARAFRQSRIEGQAMFGGPRGIWVRDGRDFVNIQQPILAASREEHSVEFRNVVVYSFGEDSRLHRITFARRATNDAGQWHLERVRTINLLGDRVERKWKRKADWQTTIRPELLDSAVTRPYYMSIGALLDQLEYLGANGLDDRVYRSAFWDKVFYPLTTLALVLAGMPFVFGLARQHSIGVRMFIGMSLGGLIMIIDRAAENMGDAYSLPASLSVAGPSVLLAITVIVLLRRAV